MCVGVSASSLHLVFLLLLLSSVALPSACGHRLFQLEQASSLEMAGAHTHAEGLEAEHIGAFQAWPVTLGDKEIIREILAMLNPPGSDITWKWQNTGNSWTFGAVMMTAQTPTGALALHMLHRHGLAPLLASRAGQNFEEFHRMRVQVKAPDTELARLQVLVASEEEYADVVKLRGLLESLTLSGLRNFHSFDHDWSVREYAGKIPGCTMSRPGDCVLQAGLSKNANSFLRRNGFTRRGCYAATAAGDALMQDIVGSKLLQLEPGHAGSTTSFQGQVIKTGPTLDEKEQSGLLSGQVIWEGGARSSVSISMTVQEMSRVSGPSSYIDEGVALDIVDRWLKERIDEMKDFVRVRRLELWAFEESEFVAMHDRLPKKAYISRDFPF